MSKILMSVPKSQCQQEDLVEPTEDRVITKEKGPEGREERESWCLDSYLDGDTRAKESLRGTAPARREREWHCQGGEQDSWHHEKKE